MHNESSILLSEISLYLLNHIVWGLFYIGIVNSFSSTFWNKKTKAFAVQLELVGQMMN